MKKFVTASFCCFCVVINVIGQTEIDTLYYDRNWKGCEKPFAAYYRVYALSPDNNLHYHTEQLIVNQPLTLSIRTIPSPEATTLKR